MERPAATPTMIGDLRPLVASWVRHLKTANKPPRTVQRAKTWNHGRG